MDLRSGYPFWLVKNGLINSYPALSSDCTCDVAVIGGGITGALAAHALVQEGVDVVVVDKRDIGWGSTSASTAMLQYETDQELRKLQNVIGFQQAVRAYQLGIEALDALQEIVAQLGVDCGFRRAHSIYAARYKSHLPGLQEECAIRQSAGFDVEYMQGRELQERFGVTALAAIVSSPAGQIDPYIFTHALHQQNCRRGARVYDRTQVLKVEPHSRGVLVHTDRGCQIRARKVAFATGYESQSYLKQKLADLNSTYALVSEPLKLDKIMPEPYLLWETTRPYFYLRSSGDERLVLGGGDMPFCNPEKRDRLIGQKSVQLLRLFTKFYPDVELPEVAFAWAGAFGETKDGLAYIGESAEMANAYFALGYGGNGITYSMIAARMIADLFVGRQNRDLHLFRFDR